VRARAKDRPGDPREKLDEAGRSRRLKAALGILEAPRSPARGAHGLEHSQLVFSYVLQTLSPDERSAATANLSACAQCREELEWLRAVSDALVYWPTDLARPSAPLWDRLARRILAESRVLPTEQPPETWAEPEWKEAAPGVSVHLLANDAEMDRVSLLVRLARGAHYPPHRHAGVEELHLLSGELVVDDQKILPGGYLRSESGSAHQLVWSQTGCTCFLTTSAGDELG
jgi:anti-sigma factor ChrR (cupin superfamily)